MITEINAHLKRQLPYIEIAEPPLKLLLDTGANQSFLSPEVIEKHYKGHPLLLEPFTVTNLNSTSVNNYAVEVPSFPEIKENTLFKYYIYRFHNIFDGLIGFEMLEKLQAKVDLKNKLLITPNAQIPIKVLTSETKSLFEALIRSNSTKSVKVPVDIRHGDIYIPRTNVNNCYIPETVTRAKSGYAHLQITNPTNNDIITCLSSPLKAQRLNNNYVLYNLETTSEKNDSVLAFLRTDHLNVEEKCNLTNLCGAYSDVFYTENTPLTFTNKMKHHINTTDEIPIYTRSYRYPQIHKAEVDRQIKSMLEQNIIQPSNSPWSSPIWIVPKKQDATGQTKWRLVVDYRKLNEKTISDKYPIPNINDILDKLGRCQYFTVLDLASGFHQIEMNPNDIDKTAFSVDTGNEGYRGQYAYLRMPFGLKNAPSSFQRVMDNVLRGLKNVMVYMDDIIVYSTSLQEHIQNLEDVFRRLRESNFKIQLNKSEFMKRETPFLGHIITTNGIKPDPDKIKAVQQFPIPKTVKEIKSFLGLLGYYRKFIPQLAKLTKPLTSCLKKGAKIELTPTYIECFKHCQNLLSNDPILQYPDFEKEFNLRTDSSNLALGAVLSQGPIGSDLPIAYASRTLNDSETKYSTIEKELLAIVWATKYFRPYLYGRKFKIITDHKPLQYLMNIKEPNSRLVRWRLRLEEYDYTITYEKGKLNTNADALSRIELQNNEINQSKSNHKEKGPLSMLVNHSDISESDSDSEDNLPLATLARNLSLPESSTSDEDDLPLAMLAAQPQAATAQSTVHSQLESPVLEIPITEKQINTFDNQLFLNFVYHSPTKPKLIKIFSNKNRILAQINKNNIQKDIIKLFKEYIKPNVKYGIFTPDEFIPAITSILQNIFKNSAYNLIFCKTHVQDVTDREKQFEIIKHIHDGPTNHRGILETEQRIKLQYYWPNVKNSVTEYINNCDVCQTSKYERHPNKQPYQIVPLPTRPFEILHIDTFTVNNQKFLTIIDLFSKYAQAYPLQSVTGLSVLNALSIYMSHHGPPLCITADQGTEFKNQLIRELAKLHKIKLHLISVNNPESNGAIERFHSTILEHIRIISKNHSDLTTHEIMVYAIIGYNNSIHSATKKKPMEIINGHFNNRDLFDIDIEGVYLQHYINRHKDVTKELYANINKTLLEHQERVMLIANKDRSDPPQYKENHALYVKNPVATRQKTKPRYVGRKIKKNLEIKVIDDRDISHHKRTLRVPLKQQKPLFQDSPSRSIMGPPSIHDEAG
jgi:hypothetical protein